MANPRRREEQPVIPTPKLREHAKALLHYLSEDGGARFVLWDKEKGDPIELSEEIFELLRNILVDLTQNRAVSVLPLDLELTTVQSAEFLQISRPYLVKLIEAGKLPCRMVGTHRRIKLSDLMAYRTALADESKAIREQMTKEAEKLGWGY